MTTRESMECPFCKEKLVFVRVTNGDWGLCCPECCFALPTFRTQEMAGDKCFALCDQIALRVAAKVEGARAELAEEKAKVAALMDLLDGKTVDAKFLLPAPLRFVEMTFELPKDGGEL